MTLSHSEFVRRFKLHILPKRYVRIRHYGILSSTWKRSKLTNLKSKLKALTVLQLPVAAVKSYNKLCPCCKSGRIITLLTFGRRGTPIEFYKAANEKQTFLVSI